MPDEPVYPSVVPLTAPRRQPLPLPDTFVRVADTLGLPGPTLADDVTFTLRRRKEGTEIGLRQGELWWSLSMKTGVYPPSFKEARLWVAAYGLRYGWKVHEEKR